jgi:hypothetical protein
MVRALRDRVKSTLRSMLLDGFDAHDHRGVAVALGALLPLWREHEVWSNTLIQNSARDILQIFSPAASFALAFSLFEVFIMFSFVSLSLSLSSSSLAMHAGVDL